MEMNGCGGFCQRHRFGGVGGQGDAEFEGARRGEEIDAFEGVFGVEVDGGVLFGLVGDGVGMGYVVLLRTIHLLGGISVVHMIDSWRMGVGRTNGGELHADFTCECGGGALGRVVALEGEDAVGGLGSAGRVCRAGVGRVNGI